MKKVASPSIAPERPARSAAFDRPLLIRGEKLADYKDLFHRVNGAIQPEDALEQIWAGDVVDRVWEANRLRRLKTVLLKAREYRGVERVLAPRPSRDHQGADHLARKWATGDREGIAEVKDALSAVGLPLEAICAETLVANIDVVERLDRMIMATEVRRDAVLREIDRHRAACGGRLQTAAVVVEEAEFTEVDVNETVTPQLEGKAAGQGAPHDQQT